MSLFTGKAAVVNIRMRVNGKEMIGKVVGKKWAWKIAKSYQAQQVSSGLLAQMDYMQWD